MASKNKSKQAIHWLTPTTMLVAFIAGILFAAGHHSFYRSLDGQTVNDAKYDQQMNLRIGTAFSYLVRAALTVTVGSAYWQIFWRTLLRSRLPVSAIDSLSGLLGGFVNFFDITALRASPVLFCVAVISLLIPLAAIVPPATLTVSAIQAFSYEMRYRPAINFETGPIATVVYNLERGPPSGFDPGAPPGPPSPGYGGSSQPLSRLALATALQGQLPNIPPPATNSSFRLEFDAPRAQCSPTSSDILGGFNSALSCNAGNGSRPCVTGNYFYLAWTPASTAVVPFGSGSMSGYLGGSSGSLPVSAEVVRSNYSYLGAYNADGDQPATLFIAVDPGLGAGDWVVLNCSLWNTTYTVDFDYSSGDQHISVVQTHDNYPVSVDWLDQVAPTSKIDMSKLGPGLSYQAVMECLGRLLGGSVFQDLINDVNHESGNAMQSEVAYTREVFPVYNLTITATGTYDTIVLDALSSPNFNRSLAEVVEEVFQNMTLALFSKQAFLGDETLPSNMTFRSLSNIYVYAPENLLLSYGLALSFSLTVVVLGLVSLWDSKASYSNKFSTIMRTTCGPHINALLASGDKTGADPLRNSLGKQKIFVGGDMASPADDGATSRPATKRKSNTAATVSERSSMLA